jgi:uncharacterized protein (TIGR03435 family)
MLFRLVVPVAALVLVPVLRAQTPTTSPTPSAAEDKPLVFDVVSIKPNHSGSPAMVEVAPPDGYAVENFRIRAIISDAFGIRYDLISGGPGWLDTDSYDLTAKVSGEDLAVWKALPQDQRNRMLQAVLKDRFHLVAHTATKELPGYTLTIAKGGLKLQPLAQPTEMSYGANMGDFDVEAISISTLADLLSQDLRQTVLDQTGLTGRYTFELKWADPRRSARSGASDDNPEGEASEPSTLPALPTALEEQLGLKLTAMKVPTTTLVIDSIDRPSEN